MVNFLSKKILEWIEFALPSEFRNGWVNCARFVLNCFVIYQLLRWHLLRGSSRRGGVVHDLSLLRRIQDDWDEFCNFRSFRDVGWWFLGAEPPPCDGELRIQYDQNQLCPLPLWISKLLGRLDPICADLFVSSFELCWPTLEMHPQCKFKIRNDQHEFCLTRAELFSDFLIVLTTFLIY